jgi:hypothetical protein
LLTAAWGILCGGLWSGFFGQLQHAGPRDISGLGNGVVVLIKDALYSVALAVLCLSVRRSVTTGRR